MFFGGYNFSKICLRQRAFYIQSLFGNMGVFFFISTWLWRMNVIYIETPTSTSVYPVQGKQDPGGPQLAFYWLSTSEDWWGLLIPLFWPRCFSTSEYKLCAWLVANQSWPCDQVRKTTFGSCFLSNPNSPSTEIFYVPPVLKCRISQSLICHLK